MFYYTFIKQTAAFYHIFTMQGIYVIHIHLFPARRRDLFDSFNVLLLL